mmetsp:Transcript_46164/g.147462  ORF Transcript_46164/g.147462 Transcript_46164/m.147462 type:complete len:908 (-) Transcript_46164:1389-4112(-)
MPPARCRTLHGIFAPPSREQLEVLAAAASADEACAMGKASDSNGTFQADEAPPQETPSADASEDDAPAKGERSGCPFETSQPGQAACGSDLGGGQACRAEAQTVGQSATTPPKSTWPTFGGDAVFEASALGLTRTASTPGPFVPTIDADDAPVSSEVASKLTPPIFAVPFLSSDGAALGSSSLACAHAAACAAAPTPAFVALSLESDQTKLGASAACAGYVSNPAPISEVLPIDSIEAKLGDSSTAASAADSKSTPPTFQATAGDCDPAKPGSSNTTAGPKLTPPIAGSANKWNSSQTRELWQKLDVQGVGDLRRRAAEEAAALREELKYLRKSAAAASRGASAAKAAQHPGAAAAEEPVHSSCSSAEDTSDAAKPCPTTKACEDDCPSESSSNEVVLDFLTGRSVPSQSPSKPAETELFDDLQEAKEFARNASAYEDGQSDFESPEPARASAELDPQVSWEHRFDDGSFTSFDSPNHHSDADSDVQRHGPDEDALPEQNSLPDVGVTSIRSPRSPRSLLSSQDATPDSTGTSTEKNQIGEKDVDQEQGSGACGQSSGNHESKAVSGKSQLFAGYKQLGSRSLEDMERDLCLEEQQVQDLFGEAGCAEKGASWSEALDEIRQARADLQDAAKRWSTTERERQSEEAHETSRGVWENELFQLIVERNAARRELEEETAQVRQGASAELQDWLAAEAEKRKASEEMQRRQLEDFEHERRAWAATVAEHHREQARQNSLFTEARLRTSEVEHRAEASLYFAQEVQVCLDRETELRSTEEDACRRADQGRRASDDARALLERQVRLLREQARASEEAARCRAAAPRGPRRGGGGRRGARAGAGADGGRRARRGSGVAQSCRVADLVLRRGGRRSPDCLGGSIVAGQRLDEVPEDPDAGRGAASLRRVAAVD